MAAAGRSTSVPRPWVRGHELMGTEQGGVRPHPAASRSSVTRGPAWAAGVTAMVGHSLGTGLPPPPGTRALLPLPLALWGEGGGVPSRVLSRGPVRIPHFCSQGPRYRASGAGAAGGDQGADWLESVLPPRRLGDSAPRHAGGGGGCRWQGRSGLGESAALPEARGGAGPSQKRNRAAQRGRRGVGSRGPAGVPGRSPAEPGRGSCVQVSVPHHALPSVPSLPATASQGAGFSFHSQPGPRPALRQHAFQRPHSAPGGPPPIPALGTRAGSVKSDPAAGPPRESCPYASCRDRRELSGKQ